MSKYGKNKTMTDSYFLMSVTQNECFIELFSFDDLARFACAFREYPKRVYSQDLDGSRIISSSITLANTLLIFYTPIDFQSLYSSSAPNLSLNKFDIQTLLEFVPLS